MPALELSHRSFQSAQGESTLKSAFGLPTSVGVDFAEQSTWSDASASLSSGPYDPVVRALGALAASAIDFRAWLAAVIAEIAAPLDRPDDMDAPWRNTA